MSVRNMDGLQGGINMDKNTKKMNGEVSQGSYVLRTALVGAVFSFLLYVILIGRSYADILLTFTGRAIILQTSDLFLISGSSVKYKKTKSVLL